jgi:two-component system sensor histidine kinase UhpB
MKYLSDKFGPFYSAALLNMQLMRAVTVLTGFILVLLPTCLMAAAGTDPLKMNSLHQIYAADPLDITTAEFMEIDVDSPPTSLGARQEWVPIELPHLWIHDERETRVGWYRFKLEDKPLEGKQALYLWRFSMNVAVWLNDEFLGDGGRFEEPIARNWNRPFLFLLPNSAWNEADNYLYIKLAVYSGWGHLPPIIIGPFAELRKDYERRFTWQITFSQATFFISIITALVSITLWTIDRKSTLYGIFGLTCLAWSIYSLNNYIQEIPISAKTWWWLVHSSIDWYGVTLALFAHRLMGVHAPIRDKLAIGFGVLATLSYALMELRYISAYNSYFHLVTLLIATYLLVLALIRSKQTRALDIVVFTLSLSTVVAFGIHDLSMNSMVSVGLWKEQFFWLQFSAPILMITMLIVLSRRFVLSLRQQVNTEQQILRERERIYSDIHDDVGSKILSLVYSAETEAQAELARDALRQIRSIVAGATSGGGLLHPLLDTYRAEAQQRCDASDIALTWRDDVTDNIEIGDSFQYQTQRIFRELISNCLQHAGTQQIDVDIRKQPSALQISVRDYGSANLSDGSFNVSGNGIPGIKRRVTELGGEISWQSANPGCTVEATIPFHPPKREH